MKNVRTTIRYGLWTLLAVATGITLVSLLIQGGSLGYKLVSANKDAIEEAQENSLAQLVHAVRKDQRPISFRHGYQFIDSDTMPNVDAEAYAVYDLDLEEIIIEKNPQKQYPIASITKLVTTMTAFELFGRDELATVTSRALATIGEAGFRRGEKVPVVDLVYAALLKSSNDATEILAEHYGRANFIRQMNENMLSLGIYNTKFDDPSGLSINNTSTIDDLVKLARHIYNFEPTFDMSRAHTYRGTSHAWSNISKFHTDPRYRGGKTGYTGPAKQTLVSLFSLPKFEDRTFAIVILQSDSREADVQKLLRYLEANVIYR